MYLDAGSTKNQSNKDFYTLGKTFQYLLNQLNEIIQNIKGKNQKTLQPNFIYFLDYLILHLELYFKALRCGGPAFLVEWLSPHQFLPDADSGKLCLTLSD